MAIRLWLPLLIAIAAIAVVVAFLSDDEPSPPRVVTPPPATPPLAAEPAPPEPPPAASPEVVPPPSLVARGRVLRLPEGTPVDGVTVELRRTPSWLSPLVVAAVTAEDGSFLLTGDLPERSAGAVHVRRDGLLPWCSGRLEAGVTEVDLGDIALIPAAPLPGRVLRADGTPLAGTRVIAIADPAALAALGELAAPYRHGIPYLTDGDGRFVAETIGASVRLVVESGSGPSLDAGAFPLPPADEATIILPPGRVWEFVIHGADGAPVRGAEVRAAGSGLGASGPDGRVRFADDRAELPDLRIVHIAHETLELGTVAHAESAIEVELRAARWLLLDLAGEDWAPHAPAIGSIRGDGFEAPLVPVEGRLRSVPVPAASREGALLVPGYAPVELTWPAGSGAHDLGTVGLERGTRLVVAVTDPTGAPVLDAEVRLHARNIDARDRPRLPSAVRTDSAGLARIGGLPAVELTVTVDHPEYVRWSGKVTPAEALETPVDARLVPGARVLGRVVSSDGSPVPLARVSPRSGARGGGALDSVETDDSGAFSIGRLPPEERISLQFHSPRHPTSALELGEFALGEVRTLPAPIVLDLGAVLRGSVRDLAGNPVARARVDLSPAAAALDGRGAVSDAHGAYELPGIRAGSYRARIRASGYIPIEEERELEFAAGETVELDFALDPGASFRGQILSHGEPAPGIGVRIISGRTGDPDRTQTDTVRSDDAGEFEILAIPRGPVELAVQLEWDMLTIPAENVARLPRTIDLPPGSRLFIVPIPVDGGPLPRSVTLHFGEPVDPSSRPPPMVIEGQSPNRRRGGREMREIRDGIAEFGFRSAGRLEFDVTADGFEPSDPIVVELGRRAVERVEVRLVRTRE